MKTFCIGVVTGIVITLLAVVAGFFDTRPFGVWGRFSATPKVEFLADGRQVKLLEDFIFTDKDGKEWVAEKDHIVDGASIPQIFWTVTEGPLDGKFRNASIVHDVGCDEKKKPWQAVHLCFYEACRCGGVPEYKAKMLYTAVYLFGPRWETTTQKLMQGQNEPAIEIKTTTVLPKVIPPPDAKDKIEQFIKDKNPTLEELKALKF